MRHTVTIENIDAKLLFEQKCDLLDLIGFLESLYENYPNYAFPKKRLKVSKVSLICLTPLATK